MIELEKEVLLINNCRKLWCQYNRVTRHRHREATQNNRPEALGGPTANRTYTDEERAALGGRLLEVEPVAELVLDAIRRNTLYIHTHSEAAEFFGKRAARISAAFADAL